MISFQDSEIGYDRACKDWVGSVVLCPRRAPEEFSMMRRSLWIIVPILLAAIGAPHAHADAITDGTLHFTLSTGSLAAPTGSFVFDNTTNQFTSFLINWNGQVFDLINAFAAANDNPNTSLYQQVYWSSVAPGPCAGATGAIANFNVLSNGGTCGPLTYVADSANSEMSVVLEGDPLDKPIGADSNGFDIPAGTSAGGFTVSEVAITPESGTVGLMLMGIGFLLVMRKRMAPGLQ
jgi:hypothetical protein